jgi:hypothetical protein
MHVIFEERTTLQQRQKSSNYPNSTILSQRPAEEVPVPPAWLYVDW